MSRASGVSDRTTPDAVERARAYGLDLTLLIENLRRTPTERLRSAETALFSVVAFQEEALRARQQSRSNR